MSARTRMPARLIRTATAAMIRIRSAAHNDDFTRTHVLRVRRRIRRRHGRGDDNAGASDDDAGRGRRRRERRRPRAEHAADDAWRRTTTHRRGARRGCERQRGRERRTHYAAIWRRHSATAERRRRRPSGRPADDRRRHRAAFVRLAMMHQRARTVTRGWSLDGGPGVLLCTRRLRGLHERTYSTVSSGCWQGLCSTAICCVTTPAPTPCPLRHRHPCQPLQLRRPCPLRIRPRLRPRFRRPLQP